MRYLQSHIFAHLVPLTIAWILVVICSSYVESQQIWSPWKKEVNYVDDWTPWRPPWYDFNNEVVVRTTYGDVRGFSVPWHIEDEIWNPDWEEYPRWFTRRLNCFLGIPYAQPPIGRLRFMEPKPPRWGGTWEAKWYRPACPQDLTDLRKEIPDFPKQNMSEDCLYMNIFAPNLTYHSPQTLYPVLVWFHSGDFSTGSAQAQPGHVLATKMIIVVTFNYRLGPFGFLTTDDEHASGNWGLLDQHLALDFVKQNIRAFRGDPNRITISGDSAGGVSVGLHLLSPLNRGARFFHQAIMMSGTDLSMFGFVKPYWRPQNYASQLAVKLGCDSVDTYVMMTCLRNNNTHTMDAVLEAARNIVPVDGEVGIVWGPTQDGGWYAPMAFVPETPWDMRRAHNFLKIPTIIGIDTQAGAKLANKTVRFLEMGMSRETLRGFIDNMLKHWNIQDVYLDRAIDATEFQYTYWPDPTNGSARTQEFVNMITDLHYGMAMDEVVKLQSQYENTFMYQFNYKSWSDWVPKWMGVSYSAAVPYVLGFPFLNETVLNETEMLPRQYYDNEDRNMSDWMMYMWSNFVKYGEPTINITRNVTWDPFNFNNLSYLVIDEHSHTWYRYRQSQYSFWRDYFPTIAKQEFYFATPTPAGYEYVIATGSMSALLIVLLSGAGMLIYVLWWHSDQQKMKEQYADSNVPLSFLSPHSRSTSRATSQSTIASSKKSLPVGAWPQVQSGAQKLPMADLPEIVGPQTQAPKRNKKKKSSVPEWPKQFSDDEGSLPDWGQQQSSGRQSPYDWTRTPQVELAPEPPPIRPPRTKRNSSQSDWSPRNSGEISSSPPRYSGEFSGSQRDYNGARGYSDDTPPQHHAPHPPQVSHGRQMPADWTEPRPFTFIPGSSRQGARSQAQRAQPQQTRQGQGRAHQQHSIV